MEAGVLRCVPPVSLTLSPEPIMSIGRVACENVTLFWKAFLQILPQSV